MKLSLVTLMFFLCAGTFVAMTFEWGLFTPTEGVPRHSLQSVASISKDVELDQGETTMEPLSATPGIAVFDDGKYCQRPLHVEPLPLLSDLGGNGILSTPALSKSPSLCIKLSTTQVIYNFSSFRDLERLRSAAPLDPRLFQTQGPIVERDSYPCVEDIESTGLPPYIYVPMPCFAANDLETRSTDNAPVQTNCGCEDRVATVDDVFVRVGPRLEEGMRALRPPVAAARVLCGNTTVLAAIDRSSERLDFLRCAGWWDPPTSFDELVHALQSGGLKQHVEQPKTTNGSDADEVLFTTSWTNFYPGHSFEAMVTLMAHYFNSGLHKRRVPWLLTKEGPELKTLFEQFFLEVIGLLRLIDPKIHIPVAYAVAEPTGQRLRRQGPRKRSGPLRVYHCKRVHFAPVWYGMRSSCAYPWVVNYLIPGALKKAASLGLSRQFKKVIVGLKLGRAESGITSARRSFNLSEVSRAFFQRHRFHMPNHGKVLSLAERIWYTEHADFIITGWGSSSTILMNSLNITRGRELRVLLLVHSGYTLEFDSYFRGSPGHFPGENTIPQRGGVFRGVLQRRDGNLVDACGDKRFRVKILRLSSLDELTDEDLEF